MSVIRRFEAEDLMTVGIGLKGLSAYLMRFEWRW